MELSEVPLSRGKGMKNNGKFRDNDESWNLGGEEKKQEGSVTRVMLIHLPSANHPIDFIFVTWISVNHDVLTDVRPPKSLRKKKKKGGEESSWKHRNTPCNKRLNTFKRISKFNIWTTRKSDRISQIEK